MPGPRQAVRALVIGEDAHILLVRAVDKVGGGPWWWELPGGGIEADEDAHAALRRELQEEAGLIDVEIGPAVWTWRGTWRFADREVDQADVVLRCRVAGLPEVSDTELPDEGVLGAEWVDLTTLADQVRSGQPTVPPGLDRLAAEVVENSHVDSPAPRRVDVGQLPPVAGDGPAS